MLKKIATALVAGSIAMAGSAWAVVTPVSLSNGVAETGTSLEDDITLANDATFFTFNAEAGADVDIDINRLVAASDLFAVLFFGDVAGADFGGDLLDVFTFTAAGDVFGPLVVVGFEDDTEDDTLGGPFGDPRFTLTLADAGVYTIVVGQLSPDEPGTFEIIANGILDAVDPDVIPLPAAFPLFLAGLAGLRIAGRKKKTA